MKNEALEQRYASDIILLRLYQKKLPKAGWPGATDDVERQFVAATRREQGRKPRGRPFSQKPHAPPQRSAWLVRGEEEFADPSPHWTEQAAS